ncbi:MAG: hypothetical protein WCC32_01120 [Terriglobales bacterium]
MAATVTSLPQNPGVLQDLLHLLSQPLTTLHCALEHSLTQDETERSEEVVVALEQTGRLIEAVRLMREYLEAEEGCFLAEPFPVGLAMENVLDQLSVLTEARGIHLFACGASKAAIPVKGTWLERALFYLIGLVLEGEPAGRAITLVLEDGDSQSVISGHSLPTYLSSARPPDRPSDLLSHVHCENSPDSNTLRQVKMEIARRVLESSGASLEFYPGSKCGFTIRLPKPGFRRAEIPA